MSALMTTLKTSFSWSLAISFCLDIMYWASNVLVFLINTLSLSIRKQMSDRTAKLTCFGCFLNCPHPCLTWVKDVKGAKDAENTFIEDTSINGIFVKGTSI